MYMLMSTIPEAVRKEKGFYTVGGCAGNSRAWHTEHDTLEVADPDVLLTDIRIYVSSIYRILNAHIYPFDFKEWTEGAFKAIENYHGLGNDLLDLHPVLNEIRLFQKVLSAFYADLKHRYPKTRDKWGQFRKVNQCLLELGRILIPTDYTRAGRYDHDPAIPIPAFPGLEATRQLPLLSPDGNEHRFLIAQLLRERNKVTDAFRRARREVERCQMRAKG
jgi:hypothetical protein